MTTALIIGGGIAGPATAIGLHKAGINAAIYEAYPPAASDDAGAFVTIAANGQDALQAIDVLDPVLRASFPAHRIRMSDPAGTTLADITLGSGHPCPQSITRAALSSVLREEAIRRGIPVEYGKRLVSAASQDGQVTAHFDDGTSASADVIIGADGIHSAVRATIEPGSPQPRYTGLTIACGYASRAAAEPCPDGYHMMYGRRAFFGYTTAPDGCTWWFARIPGSELAPADIAAPAGCWQERLAGAFADDKSPAADIIAASDEPIVVTGAYDIPTLPVWRNAAMVVIGDAAHAASPSTAQGASMGIEDSVVLAQCLRDHERIADGLRSYEELRRERVERVVQWGASGENPSPPTPGPRRPDSGWLLKHHIDWGTDVRAQVGTIAGSLRYGPAETVPGGAIGQSPDGHAAGSPARGCPVPPRRRCRARWPRLSRSDHSGASSGCQGPRRVLVGRCDPLNTRRPNDLSKIRHNLARITEKDHLASPPV
jgi:2-polyprenyl-6-methoxyphenol hydroxylase-like FAD-dependent oxidoreductase